MGNNKLSQPQYMDSSALGACECVYAYRVALLVKTP